MEQPLDLGETSSERNQTSTEDWLVGNASKLPHPTVGSCYDVISSVEYGEILGRDLVNRVSAQSRRAFVYIDSPVVSHKAIREDLFRFMLGCVFLLALARRAATA
jgi:hypothetical protein